MAHAASPRLPPSIDPQAGGEAFPSLQPNDDHDVGERSSGKRWTRVCAVEDIPRLGARVLRRLGEPNVAVFRSAGDRLFALLDRCPHRGGPLSQGIVYAERVACPLHNTAVELESGNAVAPDKGCVKSFAVKVEKGVVYVDLRVHADVDG